MGGGVVFDSSADFQDPVPHTGVPYLALIHAQVLSLIAI